MDKDAVVPGASLCILNVCVTVVLSDVADSIRLEGIPFQDASPLYNFEHILPSHRMGLLDSLVEYVNLWVSPSWMKQREHPIEMRGHRDSLPFEQSLGFLRCILKTVGRFIDEDEPIEVGGSVLFLAKNEVPLKTVPFEFEQRAIYWQCDSILNQIRISLLQVVQQQRDSK